MQQELIDLQGQIDESTIIVGEPVALCQKHLLTWQDGLMGKKGTAAKPSSPSWTAGTHKVEKENQL